MSNMTAIIYTINPIGERNMARKFLKILEKNQLSPQKIGLFEPLKLDYTFEKAVEMWTQEDDGCYVEGIGNTGKAGGLMGKSKNPLIRFNMNWWRSPIKVYVNYIDLYFPIKTFRKNKENIENTFRETIILVNGIYGYITHKIPEERQHVTGTIETRMPGVFWCNYFGEKYIEFFGEEKIVSFPWFNIEYLENEGIISYLANEPDKDLIKSDDLEMQAKVHLGINSFGDIDAYKANPEEIQIKNVPKF
jgi:ribosomal protein S17E